MIDHEHSKSLDSVRGLAAMVVLLAHALQWFYCPLVGWEDPVVQLASHLAHFSVLSFFALSGHVITHSLIENARRNGGRVSWSVFLRHRVARILPPAVAALGFALLIGGVIEALHLHGAEGFRTERDLWVERETVAMNPVNVVATLFLSNGVIPNTKAINLNPPTWSLSLEFWAYLLALVVALGISKVRSGASRRWLGGAGWGTVFLMGLGCLASRPLALAQYFVYWLIGSICYFRPRYRLFVDIFLGITVCLGGLCLIPCARLHEPWNLVMENGAAGVWAVPVKAAILVALIAVLRWIPALAGGRVFRVLASSSYTLYLFHYPMMLFAFSCSHLAYLDWSPARRAGFVFLLVAGIVFACHQLARCLENKVFWLSLLPGRRTMTSA